MYSSLSHRLGPSSIRGVFCKGLELVGIREDELGESGRKLGGSHLGVLEGDLGNVLVKLTTDRKIEGDEPNGAESAKIGGAHTSSRDRLQSSNRITGWCRFASC